MATITIDLVLQLTVFTAMLSMSSTQKLARLVGGKISSGIVEVSLDMSWETLCGEGFSITEATVVCRELGYEQGRSLPAGSYGVLQRDRYTTRIANCTGSETSITSCRFSSNQCISGGRQYAAVNCFNRTTADENSIRLSVNGQFDFSQQVLVYMYGIWGQICNDFWDDSEAVVTCKHMGYAGGIATTMSYEETTPYVISEINCYGNETDLGKCQQISQVCDQSKSAAGVWCYISSAPSVSLIGGKAHYGTVLIQADNKSGTVCSASWTTREADVVCRQLGFISGYAIPGISDFANVPDIMLTNVSCDGPRGSLFRCYLSFNLTDPSCIDHKRDARVYCFGSVRLAAGRETDDFIIGSVEMYVDNLYIPVCSGVVTDNIASLVCLDLQYNSARILPPGGFGRYSSKYITNVTCTMTAKNISECSIATGKCPRNEPASLVCLKPEGVYEIKFLISNVKNGYVYVHQYGTNATICRRGWDDDDASVICKENGYKGGVVLGTPKLSSIFRQDPVWASDFRCTRELTSLSDCAYSRDVPPDCLTDSTLAGVLCYTHYDTIQYRLASGKFEDAGRVEIYFDGRWGTICDNLWSRYDARVFCRSLGYADGTSHGSSFDWATGTNPVYMSGLECDGTEHNILECPNHGWMNIPTTCQDHTHDAGAVCYKYVKLHPSTFFGAVQFWSDGNYGLTCADNFDDNAATVTCRELGFQYGMSLCCSAAGPIDLPIVLTNVSCNGTESSLTKCSANTSIHLCLSGTYATVVCTNFHSSFSGRVIINRGNFGPVQITYYNNQGVLCSEDFGNKEASVICRQNGYHYGMAYKEITSDTRSIRWLRGLGCNGHEESIRQCSNLRFGQISSCAWDTIAAVYCTNDETNLKVDVRLKNGTENEGRVEMSIGGQWGSICANDLTQNEADVICHHLGYHGGGLLQPVYNGNGNGSFILTSLRCPYGNETNIGDCYWKGLGETNTCRSSAAAVVECFMDVRLSGSSIINYGMLEVYDRSGKTWMAVCDEYFYSQQAAVVCQQLGYADGKPQCCSPLGTISGPITVRTISCKDGHCDVQKGMCTSNHYLAVYCSKITIDNEGFSVRLPLNSFYGPVEVSRYGLWGAMCDVDFDDADASVVCRELGYQNGVKVSTVTNQGFPVIQGSVRCTGSEESLTQCHRGDFRDDHGCSGRSTVAGVICSSNGRVVVSSNLSSDHSGLMLIQIGSDSLKIASENVTDVEAAVYCRSLGFPSGRLQVFSYGSYDITKVSCNGSETSFLLCKGYWDPRKAGNGTRAGVKCDKAESPSELEVKADAHSNLVSILIGVTVTLVLLLVIVIVIVLFLTVKRRNSKSKVHYNQGIVEQSMDGSFSVTNQLHGVVGTPDVRRARINVDGTVVYTKNIPDAYSNPGYSTLPVITNVSITQEPGQVYDSAENITNATATETEANGYERMVNIALPTGHDNATASDATETFFTSFNDQVAMQEN